MKDDEEPTFSSFPQRIVPSNHHKCEVLREPQPIQSKKNYIQLKGGLQILLEGIIFVVQLFTFLHNTTSVSTFNVMNAASN